ncbi:hypothetical protein MATR_03130 [Marivirga tractuosa]|uniref:Outer membrane lipoprotein-sorting protein n=1 Tax=Marivirga tractuosa (strain ATCC 23168 / DSM 4126 / NBRC 15989 / NCIMB 1408 / VKM B-1430 / H-43) TaxID=643867 RepID=E4TUD5_MARTH|nr:hypothetical protein [Marivirga tractuosa]ADR22053.1 hypothetical protein Ftrac_2069 [Marivirga tractuosa DSM 4126]BDD13488.1 hypothetical protein MATR_03130 [Marivirga tractuosa]|tara:strand:+ start:126015 stop:126692 length:678 start_codon:yes stop_codon:yes gene_type:complete
MRSALLTLIACLQLAPAILYGQEKEMFIQQIAQKRIVRENYDQNGDLQGKQIFLTGELEQQGKTYRIKVITELYDESGRLTEKYTTTYKCNPNEFDVLLNVFPFADPRDAKITVDVTSKDFKQLYDLQRSPELRDIHLKMSIESGILSFFGSKSLITIKDRDKRTENGNLVIRSKAVIEAYMMGLKIKTINYSVEEYLTENFVLQRQKFIQDDGTYFTMEYDDSY